jgi:hypothetical protein
MYPRPLMVQAFGMQGLGVGWGGQRVQPWLLLAQLTGRPSPPAAEARILAAEKQEPLESQPFSK